MTINFSNNIRFIQEETIRINDITATCLADRKEELNQIFPAVETFKAKFNADYEPLLQNLESGDFVKNGELRKLVKNVMANLPEAKLDLANLKKYNILKDIIINSLRLLIHKIKLVLSKSYVLKFNKCIEKITGVFRHEIDSFLTPFLNKYKEKYKTILAVNKSLYDLKEKMLASLTETENKIGQSVSELGKSKKPSLDEQSKSNMLQTYFKILQDQLDKLKIEEDKQAQISKTFNKLCNNDQKVRQLLIEIEKPKKKQKMTSLSTQTTNQKVDSSEPTKPIENEKAPNFAAIILDKLDAADKPILEKFNTIVTYLGWLFDTKSTEIEKVTLQKDTNHFELVFKLNNTVQKYIHQDVSNQIDGGKVYNLGDNPNREVVIRVKHDEPMKAEVVCGIDFYIKSLFPGLKGEIKAELSQFKFNLNNEKQKEIVNESSKNQSFIEKCNSFKAKALPKTMAIQEALVQIPLTGKHGVFIQRDQQVNASGQQPLEFHKTQREFFQKKRASA